MPPKNETENNSNNTPDYPVGHSVFQGKTYCGTFETAEDAQAFIDQQLTPQGLEAKVVENVGE